jgi:adhesin/invasin
LRVDYSVSSAPTASNVTISGTPQVGQVLTGNYTYSDPNGDAEATSTFRWLRNGAAISQATARTYTLVTADQGAMIVFEVTPRAATGASPGSAVQSPAVGPVIGAGPNGAPTASNVSISGTPQVGATLTGNYTYSDVDGDAQGTSTFRWLRNGAAIGATARTYVLVAADEGASIVFEVTPVAVAGTSPGAPVQSPAVGPVAGPVSVTSITPNVMSAGGSINVTINGTNFASGATVVLQGGAGPNPSATNVTVVNSSTITATITVGTGGPKRDRLWNVRVTNPGGPTGVLSGGLTVRP